MTLPQLIGEAVAGQGADEPRRLPFHARGPAADHAQLRARQLSARDQAVHLRVHGKSLHGVVGPVVGGHPEGLVGGAWTERVEHARVGTGDDDGVRAAAVEPTFGMVVTHPGGDEDGVIGDAVRAREERVHVRRPLACVALVDAVQAHQAGAAPLELLDVGHSEGGELPARVDDERAIRVLLESGGDGVAVPAKVVPELADELVAAAIWTAAGCEVDGDPGPRPPSRLEPTRQDPPHGHRRFRPTQITM
jgi:hypothetical protein